MRDERRLRLIIRERAERGEGINEIFGWIKRKWQELTDSDLERVQRAASMRGSRVPFVHEDDWYYLAQEERDSLLQMAEEWHDLPESEKIQAKTQSIRSTLLRAGGKRGGSSPSRSSGRSQSSHGGGGYGGYYDSYYGYGYGGYYGGGSSPGKSHKDESKDDKKDPDDDDDGDGESGSGSGSN